MIPRLAMFAASAAGAVFLLLKGLGLTDDLAGSHLHLGAAIRFHLHPAALLLAMLFSACAAATWRLRRRLAGRLALLARAFSGSPARALLLTVLGLLALHALLFWPFRHRELVLPDPQISGHQIDWSTGARRSVPAETAYEDYTRNYVTANAVRRLGPGRWFELDRAPELTPPEQRLCRWTLTHHPPGYPFLLAPFTASPVAARALSLVLYALVIWLVGMCVFPLAGLRAALLTAILFWAVPANLFFFGMMTSNDLAVAVPLLGSLALVLSRPDPGPRRLLLAGTLLGVALLFKYTVLLAIPTFGVILLIRTRGRRWFSRGLLYFLPLLLFAVGWGLVLARTPWFDDHAGRVFGRLLRRAVDPTRIGTAKSTARGSILEFLAFIPVELGLPLAVLVLATLASLLRRPSRIGRREIVLAVWYGIPFVGAFLTIPKTNYFFFAQAGLVALAALWARRRGPAGIALLLTAAEFGVFRFVLYGLQTG